MVSGLFASKNESLLIRGDAFLVLNFLLDIFYCVARLDVKGDRFARQRLDKDLHAAAARSPSGTNGYSLPVERRTSSSTNARRAFLGPRVVGANLSRTSDSSGSMSPAANISAAW